MILKAWSPAPIFLKSQAFWLCSLWPSVLVVPLWASPLRPRLPAVLFWTFLLSLPIPQPASLRAGSVRLQGVLPTYTSCVPQSCPGASPPPPPAVSLDSWPLVPLFPFHPPSISQGYLSKIPNCPVPPSLVSLPWLPRAFSTSANSLYRPDIRPRLISHHTLS